MRIISGQYGRRNIASPNGHKTHPMSEKIRGALFNVLGDIVGLSVLDVCSGSGAIAIEALSRGATTATAIESDAKAIKVIKQNIETLALQDRLTLVQANARSWSANNKQAKFNIVVCDPPYNHVQPQLIRDVTRHIAPDGIYILSWPGDERPLAFDNLRLISNKQYGDSQLFFYKPV